ncbi:MAG TPA: hydroxymethylbilane synthase [Chthonomonadaceae bacterium]|nr:hydroxymethylbilane synthase [Chthonomonadaceae bacterium]
MKQRRTLRVGTRGSLLARRQTEIVVQNLQDLHPGLEVIIEVVQTTGDRRRDVPFTEVGTKGMFVKEIEQALLDGVVDIGVHSLKDMPGEMPAGLELSCIPAREDPRDALLTRDGATLDDLLPGSVVGTSSLRRQAQLRYYRPDLHFTELRGNLDTRLARLDAGEYDAIVLACAGLDRLGLGDRISQRIETEVCVPAVGQGALALEIRAEEEATRELLRPLNDPDTLDSVTAERAFLAELQGGCTVPAGAFAMVVGTGLGLQAVIAAPDGSRVFGEVAPGPREDAAFLGAQVARRLLDGGGRTILNGKG